MTICNKLARASIAASINTIVGNICQEKQTNQKRWRKVSSKIPLHLNWMTPGPFYSKCFTRSYTGVCQRAAGETDRATGHVWTLVLCSVLSHSRAELWVSCFALKSGLCAQVCICVLLLVCKFSKCACAGVYSFTNCLLAPGVVKSEHSLSWTVLTWSLFLWRRSH